MRCLDAISSQLHDLHKIAHRPVADGSLEPIWAQAGVMGGAKPHEKDTIYS